MKLDAYVHTTLFGGSIIDLTTPGPAGLAARRLASDLDLPLIGRYHTELGEYTARLSGSARLGRAMQDYLRWIYGACERVLVPSNATAQRRVTDGWRQEQLAVWTGGVDSDLFHPRRRSAALRTAWRVSDTRPAILYAGRLFRGEGTVAAARGRPAARRVPHVTPLRNLR